MVKASKTLKILVFTLLTATLLMAAINLNLPSVKAQTQDSVAVQASLGGTTDPAGGTTANYADGSTATFTATAGVGFLFLYWEIASASGGTIDNSNPLQLTVSQSAYVIQAIFTPVTQIPPATTSNAATNAIVVVLPGVGGTTTPPAGTYSLVNAGSLNLTATANTNWKFDHWVISGAPLTTHGLYNYTLTPTDNPYNVNHGYGNTYSYQPVFSPTGSAVSEFSSAAAVVMAVILVIVAFGAFAFNKRSKK